MAAGPKIPGAGSASRVPSYMRRMSRRRMSSLGFVLCSAANPLPILRAWLLDMVDGLEPPWRPGPTIMPMRTTFG